MHPTSVDTYLQATHDRLDYLAESGKVLTTKASILLAVASFVAAENEPMSVAAGTSSAWATCFQLAHYGVYLFAAISFLSNLYIIHPRGYHGGTSLDLARLAFDERVPEIAKGWIADMNARACDLNGRKQKYSGRALAVSLWTLGVSVLLLLILKLVG